MKIHDKTGLTPDELAEVTKGIENAEHLAYVGGGVVSTPDGDLAIHVTMRDRAGKWFTTILPTETFAAVARGVSERKATLEMERGGGVRVD